MTPQQQNALETLVGRVLDANEITTIDPLLDSDNRRDDLIAGILSTGRVKIVSKMVSARGLAEKYNGGDPIGAEITLQKLEGFVAYADALPAGSGNDTTKLIGKLLNRQLGFLNSDGLDFGSIPLRAMIDQFVAMSIITLTEADHLKNIASTSDPISQETVSRALNIAEGRMVL